MGLLVVLLGDLSGWLFVGVGLSIQLVEFLEAWSSVGGSAMRSFVSGGIVAYKMCLFAAGLALAIEDLRQGRPSTAVFFALVAVGIAGSTLWQQRTNGRRTEEAVVRQAPFDGGATG